MLGQPPPPPEAVACRSGPSHAGATCGPCWLESVPPALVTSCALAGALLEAEAPEAVLRASDTSKMSMWRSRAP